MITAAAGILFALLHIREWMATDRRRHDAVQESRGAPGCSVQHSSASPACISLHVTGGVIALIAVGLRYKGGRYNADDLEILGLYWHFVDLVWMFVVPLVYLLNLAH